MIFFSFVVLRKNEERWQSKKSECVSPKGEKQLVLLLICLLSLLYGSKCKSVGVYIYYYCSSSSCGHVFSLFFFSFSVVLLEKGHFRNVAYCLVFILFLGARLGSF